MLSFKLFLEQKTNILNNKKKFSANDVKHGYELRKQKTLTTKEIANRLGFSTVAVWKNLDSEKNKSREDYHPHVSPVLKNTFKGTRYETPKIKLSDNELKQAYNMRRQGISSSELSYRMGYSHTPLKRELDSEENKKRSDYHPGKSRSPDNPSDLINAVKKLKDSGHSYDKIANHPDLKSHNLTRGKVAGIIDRMKKNIDK